MFDNSATDMSNANIIGVQAGGVSGPAPQSAGRSSLLLDRTTWDVCLDASQNIAVCDPPYALAQEVANAIKLFLGECYYDTSRGIPYYGQILGRLPPLALFKTFMVNAALTVGGVVSAVCFVTKFTNRHVKGQVQFIDDQHNAATVSF